MIDIVKRFFSKVSGEGADTENRDIVHDVRVATCALFLEMGRIDESFTRGELDKIIVILKEKYGLSQENADAMISAAEAELEDSVDNWRFASLINKNYSTEEKIEIIECLWTIVYVDGKLDKYEDYFMHKLANLLRLSHKQLIDAKLKVLHAA